MPLFNNERFNKAVNIPNPLYQSLQGRYFVGQTEHIRFGEGKNAWGGLVNPSESDVNLLWEIYLSTVRIIYYFFSFTK